MDYEKDRLRLLALPPIGQSHGESRRSPGTEAAMDCRMGIYLPWSGTRQCVISFSYAAIADAEAHDRFRRRPVGAWSVYKHITINIWYINSISPRLLHEPEPARCLHRAEPGSHNFHRRFRNFYWSALYGDMIIYNLNFSEEVYFFKKREIALDFLQI